MNSQLSYRCPLRWWLVFIVALGVVVACDTARAQSGAALLLSPWMEGQSLELSSWAAIQGSGHTREGSDSAFQMRRYEANGRFRFDKMDEHSPAVGFELLQIDLDTPHPMLPERLVDQSVGAGFGIGMWEQWEIGLTVGAGYAGNNPYGDSHAVYAIANLIASNKISDKMSWQIFVNYDGNRTIWPDVPLPGLAFNHRLSDEFAYTFGIPYSSIRWRPLDGLTIRAGYNLPFTFDATATLELLDGLSVFGGLFNRFEAFHIDGTDENRRLFFQQRFAEAGVNWKPCEWFDVTAAGGWAFDQEFNTGFDARDLENAIEVSDEPYLRFGLNLRF